MLYDPQWKARSRKTKSQRLASIYAKAADVIERQGHCRHYLQNEEGAVCVWGAISLVVDGDARISSNETHKMLDPLREFTRGMDPVGWNNKKGRRKSTVVKMLRRAAVSLSLR